MADDKDKVLATAKERFSYALEHQSQNAVKAKEDIRFAAASPDDPWQWETLDIKAREIQQRPTLTINKMPQHIRQVTNDIRQNRPSIRYRPADNKADPEVADILMGLVRHIEANSDADVAYDTAAENQVVHGTGDGFDFAHMLGLRGDDAIGEHGLEGGTDRTGAHQPGTARMHTDDVVFICPAAHELDDIARLQGFVKLAFNGVGSTAYRGSSEFGFRHRQIVHLFLGNKKAPAVRQGLLNADAQTSYL